MKSIGDRLNKGPVILLDGAMGTELFRRGIETRLPCWSAHALIEKPDLVREVHEEYILAGAEIITTNTFRTSFRTLAKEGFGDQSKRLTDLAVDLAMQARERAGKKSIWIAGSVGPLEDCYRPELTPAPEIAAKEHREMIDWLSQAGVDLILIETMNSIEEAAAAAQAASRSGLPFFVSWVCGSEGMILNGQNVEDGVRILHAYQPAAFLINCTPPEDTAFPLMKLLKTSAVPVGAYANIGRPEPVFGWEFNSEAHASDYVLYASDWVKLGARIIGGCCGTTPEYIHALKKRFRSELI